MQTSTDLQSFLDQTFLGNPVRNLLWCAGIVIAGFLLKRIISMGLGRMVFGLLKRRSYHVQAGEFLTLLRPPVEWLLTLIILWLAFSQLSFPGSWNLAPAGSFGLRMVIHKGYGVLLIVALTWVVMRLIDFFALVFSRKAALTPSPLDDQLVPFFREVSKVCTVIFAFFFALGTLFSLNVGSILTGLGIGGLAVALAAKESLENLFASFTIFLDKPFIAGDLVQVGNILGTVEKVGFRSTRIRTMDKSFLTVPNKMMIDQPLDNQTQRRFRRAKFTIHLDYTTPPEKMQAISQAIREVIAHHELTKAETGYVHFTGFGESALQLLILYFVETADWDEFVQVQEEVNYRILQIVQEQGVSFAFPTQKIYFQPTADGSTAGFSPQEKLFP